ncbi:reverse ribonuclease integrase, partial [Lasius niger]
MGIHPQEEIGQIQLADGAPAQILGTITLTIRVRHRPITHTFSILPTLTDAMLIGVDLWARLGITLTPPCQCPANPENPACSLTHGLATCTTEEDSRLQNFLRDELPRFKDITGPTPLITHHIRLTNPSPIKQRYRPRNPAMQEIINREVEDMEKTGVIEPSRSSWSSPVVVVRKKDGKPRFCIDFRRVNNVTEKDAYPLPQVTATLDKLRGARYLTTLDLKSGYWQVPLAPESRPITAFTVPG